MSQEAPQSPTTQELQAQFPMSDLAEVEIPLGRERISEILTGQYIGLFAAVGSCALTKDIVTTENECIQSADLTRTHKGLYIVNRRPPWKPRSLPDAWFGEETDDPVFAYSALTSLAHTGISIEFGKPYHISRYGELCEFGWVGGRNSENDQLMEQIALELPSMPLGIKNGLDGDIEPTLAKVKRLNQLRGSEAAPVVLLYRGGTNTKDPESWEKLYLEALNKTDGHMIVDVAHGSEMAHDPNKKFKKSAEVQEHALEHVIEIAENRGIMPHGIMIEASDTESPTDPHIPFHVATNAILKLHALKMGVRQEEAKL